MKYLKSLSKIRLNPIFQFTILKKLKKLGEGTFGNVHLVQHKESKVYYALKQIPKPKNTNKIDLADLINERNVFTLVKSPFIVKLFSSFQNQKSVFFLMEYVKGGDLLTYLTRNSTFSEDEAQFYAAEIVLGLEELHKQNFVYRDLKLENILLDEDGHIKITDFGLSKRIQNLNGKCYTRCGTPEYFAPELFNEDGGYSFSVDWWCLGIIIYIMLTKKRPFNSTNEVENFENIKKGVYSIPNHLLANSKSIISQLIHTNPKLRLGCGRNGIKEIKDHPFFTSINWEKMREKKVKPPLNQVASINNTIDINNNFSILSVNNSSDLMENKIDEKPSNNLNGDENIPGFTYENKSLLQKIIN